jgi:plastocyanin
MSRRLVTILLSFVVCSLLALSGCGGDDDDEEEASPSGTPVETVDVTETEFEIDPANPRISTPGPVAFRVRNSGSAPHNLEVEGPNGEAELAEDLQPGQSATLRVDLSEPGTYEWYCPVGDHRERGMEGTVTVGGGGSGGTTTGETGTTGTTETSETDETGTTGTDETETTETDEDRDDDSGGSGSGGSGSGGSGGSGSGENNSGGSAGSGY